MIVTNEGNGDLTQILPRVHIVLASIEKITPTLDDVSQILRLLARSATGQDMSVYTTFSTGPRRRQDPDGPDEYHVVILDNGRSAMLGTEFQDMLRCIRCGACMNHCPVYQEVGGHAYGWVYPGPMGAVLTPTLIGVDKAGHLPNASTFCGRCEAVCPMQIPLPKMMRHWREREFERHLSPATYRYGLGALGVLRQAAAALPLRHRDRHARARQPRPAQGRFRRLPLAGGWTKHRDLPAPPGKRFRRCGRRRTGRLPPTTSRHERARHGLRQDPPLARRDRRRVAAERYGGRSAVARADRASSRRAGSCAPEEQVALFVKMAREGVGNCDAGRPMRTLFPAAVADYLRVHNLPATLRIGDDPLLNSLTWTRTQIEVKHGASDGTDAVGLSHAVAGVAETGTLVLTSGSDNPTTINFLPETHVVVVKAADVVGDYEAAWKGIRARYGKGAMPRTVNMVTGPSRSGDIEQTILLGAHGPRRLHIVVVG